MSAKVPAHSVYVATKFKMVFAVFPALLLLVSVCGGELLQEDQDQCPTWFVPHVYNGTSVCECGSSLDGKINCDPSSNLITLETHFCMTYNESNDATITGYCPYNYYAIESNRTHFWMKVPQNVSALNECMCGWLNRTGLLCGKCRPGLGPVVLSNALQCMKCLDNGLGWLLYVFLVTFPSTIFFLVILFCKIRITSGPFNVLILVCQGLMAGLSESPATVFPGTEYCISKPVIGIIHTVVTIYGFFNLHFFRYVIPPFCVTSQLSMLQVLSLEYVEAFYPLFLIITIYVCVQLHARDFKIFVYLWKPFRDCCRNWDSSETLIHAFVAFLLLSYSEILLISFTLLKSTNYPLFNDSGVTVSPMAVYYDASVKYFGSEHLPFALLAILVLAIFIVLPVLILLLYPTRVFQRCLGCCNTRWQLALRTFADAFQGCYKDGTAGTPDWRCFSGLYLLFVITTNVDNILYDDLMDLLIIIHIGTWSLLFALLQPYKKKWLNIFDSVALALYCLGHYLQNNTGEEGSAPVLYILAALPLLYIIIYLTYQLLSRMGLLRCCSNCMKLTTPQRPTRLSDCSDVPDRVDHPEEYEQLLTATDNERQVDEDALSREEDTISAFKSGAYQYGSV